MRNYKLRFYTIFTYIVLVLSVLVIGACKWNSDFRSRIQPSADPDTLTVEEEQLQDAVNETEPDSLESAVPGKPIPSAPDLPL